MPFSLPDPFALTPSGRLATLGGLVPLCSLALACGASVPAMGDDAFFSALSAPADDNCAPFATRIEHLDEPTALGFSALDVLNRVAGPRSAPLFWIAPAENQEYELTIGPEQGRSTLELDLHAADGPVLHRYRTPLLGAPEDTTCDSGAIEIPVTVTLESAAEGLAESFDTVLEARVPYRAHLAKSFEPGTLRGSLGVAHVSSLDPERHFWLGPVTLEADVWEGGSAGTLAVAIGASHAKESKELRAPPPPATQPDPIAAWPSAESCADTASALPADAKVLGFSVEDVLGRLREGGSRRLTWGDGSVTPVQLELGADQAELCQQVGESLRFSVMLRARSEDGGLDVRLPVQVEAVDAGGSIGDISIQSGAPDAPYPIHQGVNGAGSSFDADGYRAVLVGIEWKHAGDRDTGSLSLRGVDATQPDDSGVYPSTAIANGRW